MAGDRDSAVVYDLDSTLCDNAHRRHLMPVDPAAAPASATEEQWRPWTLACAEDTPMVGTLARMRLDYPHHQVHICSGRGDSGLVATKAWLARHSAPYDYLQLRAAGDRRWSWELKIAYIRNLLDFGVQVVLAYEDLKHEAERIYEATGVPVMLVNPAYEWVETLKQPRPSG